ncbi:TlpA family protein disulfide reductase [Pseudoalteromonas xiamenensis]
MKSVLQYLLIILVFIGLSWWQSKDMLNTNDSPAPYFNLSTLQNPASRITLKALQGKQTVVYLFAPWCRICRYSMPNLEKLYVQGEVNAIAIALNYDSQDEVNAFAKSLSLTMPILLGTQTTADDYRVTAFPSYYVINERLKITAKSVGYSSEVGLRIRSRVQ